MLINKCSKNKIHLNKIETRASGEVTSDEATINLFGKVVVSTSVVLLVTFGLACALAA